MNSSGAEVQSPSPLVYPLNDNACLTEILAEVTGKPPQVARKILGREQQHLSTYGNEEFYRRGLTPGVWCPELIDYYANTDAFLFGGVVWNRNPNKLAMRQWIGRYLAREDRTLRVLAYGDGPGFDSLYLALCGHEVTYFEVSDRLVRFAERIFRLSNAPVHVVTREDDLPEGAFDVVLCLDVLEHLPDPSAELARLVRCVQPGGRLIVHAPFFFVSRHMPTHLRSNLRYSGSLAFFTTHGLRLLDGRPFWTPLVLARAGDGQPLAASMLWRFFLRLTGLPFLFSRLWPGPLSWYAVSLWKGDSQWETGLIDPDHQGG